MTSVSVGSLFGYCRIAFGRIGRCRDRLGPFSNHATVQIVSKSDWERDNRDEFGGKRLNQDAFWTMSDCCRDYINLFFTNLIKFEFPARIHGILIRLLTTLNRGLLYTCLCSVKGTCMMGFFVLFLLFLTWFSLSLSPTDRPSAYFLFLDIWNHWCKCSYVHYQMNSAGSTCFIKLKDKRHKNNF